MASVSIGIGMSKHNPGFLLMVNDAKSRIRELTVEDVHHMQEANQSFHFVDVREDREFAKDRCAGAIHLGKGIIERDIEKAIPNKTDEVVLYCGGGFRSALSADNLQKMGYTNVASMDGGIRSWKENAYPLDSGEE
jgi:rhodanese-related sulfurtransferase